MARCATLSLLFQLVALAASAQNFDDIRIERVSAGHTWTQGPLWSPEGFLLFCDVPSNQIHRMDSKGLTVQRKEAGGASGLALDGSGRVYAAESRSRRITRTDRKGKIEVITDSFQGKPFNAPNDLVVTRNGHIFFTDPAFGYQQNLRQLPYAIYHVSPRGTVDRISSRETRPNGLALSPDEKALYIADSDLRAVFAYDLARDGKTENERTLITAVPGPPDGLEVDKEGNLYVAANRIEIYSPDGRHLHSIPLGEKPTNLEWGEQELKSLFATAGTSVLRIHMPTQGVVRHPPQPQIP